MRISNEQEITEKLVRITGKDYKSVWRRLRGEYKFTFEEIFNICSELDIAMESLGETNSASISTLRVYQFPEPSSLSKNYISTLFSILEDAIKSGESSYTVICNRLPEALYIKYDIISQLLLLKLAYFTKEAIDPDFFKKLIDGWPAFEVLKKRYLDLIDSFNKLTFLWGTNIIENVVKDIQFFLSVDMITKQDSKLMKKELKNMVFRLNELCSNPAPYEKFTFALSAVDMNFHSNTVTSNKINRTDFFLYHHAFCGTENELVLRSQKIIIDRLMNGAMILSGSNHSSRNRFIKKQMEIIDKI